MKANKSNAGKSIVYSHVARQMEGLESSLDHLLMFLASAANAKGTCWYSYETIVRKTGMSRRTVTRAKARLEELGIVRCEKGGCRKGKSNVYHLQLNAMQAMIPGCHGDTHLTPDPCHDDTHTRVMVAPQVDNEVNNRNRNEVNNRIPEPTSFSEKEKPAQHRSTLSTSIPAHDVSPPAPRPPDCLGISPEDAWNGWGPQIVH